MIWMLRNSRGRRDALLTFAAMGNLVVLLKVLVSGMTVGTVVFGTIDSALALAVLSATVAPYTTKRIMGGKPDAEEPKP
jgi:hypothetical protein